MVDISEIKSHNARVYADSDYPCQQLTGTIVAACHTVHNTLGFGFLEKMYRRALLIELDFGGVLATEEVPFPLDYRGVDLGTFRADVVVQSTVVVEVKTGLFLDPAAVPQTLNYLRVSGLSVGLICYFGPRLKIKRLVSTHSAIPV